MQQKFKFFALSALGLALTSAAFATTLTGQIDVNESKSFSDITSIQNANISRGNGAVVSIFGSSDLTITSSNFASPAYVNLAEGVNIKRGESIGLYDPDSKTIGPDGKTEIYKLYTEDQIKEIFATKDLAKIRKAFSTKDGYKGEDLTLQDEEKVLNALRAAKAIKEAREKFGYKIHTTGNLTIKDSSFDFKTTTKNAIEADGVLTLENTNIHSEGGAGYPILTGIEGINVLSGSITSLGSADDGSAYVYGFDDRNRLDRNRWTIGQYLQFKSDKDIVFGAENTVGPDVYVRDGMLAFSLYTQKESPQNLDPTVRIKSGSITLHAVTRSTLTGAWDYDNSKTLSRSEITGGVLNVISDPAIAADKKESLSLWNIELAIKGGEVNLVNGNLGVVNQSSGTLNLDGISATDNLTLSGGTINVASNAAIGHNINDERHYSPKPNKITLDSGVINFEVSAPTSGSKLK